MISLPQSGTFHDSRRPPAQRVHETSFPGAKGSLRRARRKAAAGNAAPVPISCHQGMSWMGASLKKQRGSLTPSRRGKERTPLAGASRVGLIYRGAQRREREKDVVW